jgi:hypothetical protein
VSLILEALKKIEREKQAPERGVVVLANAAWTGRGERTRTAPRIVAALVLLALVGGAGWVALRRSPTALPAALPTAATPPPPVAREPVVPAPIPVPLPLSEVRRPARPAAATAAASPSPAASSPGPTLHLSAISSRDGAPVAVVNDQVVQVGDLVEGARVVAIGTTSIEVEVDGQRRTISF